MRSKFVPCLYTALTTLLAFGSMLASRIVPVEDFGWMMCLGIVISFIVTYGVFPAVLLLLGRAALSNTATTQVNLTLFLGRQSIIHSGYILSLTLLAFVMAGVGISKVSFDNRFIDYFAQETDIYKGLEYIDDHLGGTVPFDIYIQFEPYDNSFEQDDDFASETDEFPERYWFTASRLETVEKLHRLIEDQPFIGKVVSVSTLLDVARGLNNGEDLDSRELAYVLGELPISIREQLVLPYANPTLGITRINARIRESAGEFSRQKLIDKVIDFSTGELGLDKPAVSVNGMMVLFNDMLQRLADSQLRTLFYVVLATFLMFSVLLRSVLLATIALIPNLLAAAMVIAFMGYAGISLDMMTITIAAISIGIGVDDAIHYLHRFKVEYAFDKKVNYAVERAHKTIGRAMYFTSMIVIVGFSVLSFSNFLPTVNFGILTAIAMFFALFANLTVLPSLLVKFYR